MGVLIPSPVPHLDRVFDYAVPDDLRGRAHFGVRVRVRFAGRLRTGFVVAERTTSEFTLQPLVGVLGPPVVTPALAGLARDVADRCVGTWGDVLAAAVPARHARAEGTVCDAAGGLLPTAPVTVAVTAVGAPAGGDPTQSDGAAWRAVLTAIGHGEAVRAALTVPWGQEALPFLAQAVAAALGRGRRVLVLVPDERDLEQAREALIHLLAPKPTVAVLAAHTGPQARYGAYLRAVAGRVDVVLGTRSAVFAPLPDLGLIWLWHDADPSLVDPQAPYWHARDVCGLRSLHEDVPLVLAGRGRSIEVQRLVELGWALEASPDRSAWRAAGPTVRALDESALARDAAAFATRLPKAAFDLVRRGLTQGPVLVQVARRGYVPAVACAACRELARCPSCQGALLLGGRASAPRCARCGSAADPWACPQCGGTRLRAVRVGSSRTAEELGQAFPGVSVITSDSQAGVMGHVSAESALVVATPGAEPVADGRYAAALLLDGEVMLSVPRLRAAEQTVDRWCEAVSLVRPAGEVLVVASAQAGAVQAMVRADPVGWAARELAERAAAGLPPAVRMIALTGAPTAVAELLRDTVAVGGHDVPALGPMPAEPGQERWLLPVTYQRAPDLARTLGEVQRERSRTRAPVVQVRVDPDDVG